MQHQLPPASGPASGVPPAPRQSGAAPTRSSPLLPFLLRFGGVARPRAARGSRPPPPPSPPRWRPGGRGAHLPDVNISEGEAREECAAPSSAQVINPCDWQVATGGLWLRLRGKSARRKDFHSSAALFVRGGGTGREQRSSRGKWSLSLCEGGRPWVNCCSSSRVERGWCCFSFAPGWRSLVNVCKALGGCITILSPNHPCDYLRVVSPGRNGRRCSRVCPAGVVGCESRLLSCVVDLEAHRGWWLLDLSVVPVVWMSA